MHSPLQEQNVSDNITSPRWSALSPHLPALLLGITALLLGLGGASVRTALQFQREAIAHGEVWRLLTCHLVHLGWVHLALDLAGLLLVWLLVGSAYGSRTWLWLLLFIALGISGGFYLLRPTLLWYVGLSGLLHGMLAAGVLGQFKVCPTESSLIMVALAAKLTWEQFHGALSTSLMTGPVVVDAHLFGAVAGATGAALLLLARHAKRRTAT